MPSTVAALVEAAKATYGGSVPWGKPVQMRNGGIYLLALTDDPDSQYHLDSPPIDPDRLGQLLDAAPTISLDGSPPTIENLGVRLGSMWVAGEPVIYIGKATSLSSRVAQYYTTRLGARSPHAGGWPLKVLANLEELWVHWATSPMPELAEQMALAWFVRNVNDASRSQLIDPMHPYPYANLEGPGGRKRHGIQRATSASVERRPTAIKALDQPDESAFIAESRDGARKTQRVTHADLNAGRIRIPRDSKDIFPDKQTEILIRLRGTGLSSRWNPRHGPPERSGTIGVGKQILQSSVKPEEVLRVQASGGIYFIE